MVSRIPELVEERLTKDRVGLAVDACLALSSG